jgi:hypothetical protein
MKQCPKCKGTGEIKPTRSTRQNSALHLLFKWISESLNDLGQEFCYTGVKGFEISTPYTPEIVKNFFWRPIQVTLFDIESTTKINTEQINKIMGIINKFFAEKGVVILFPSYDSLLNDDYFNRV